MPANQTPRSAISREGQKNPAVRVRIKICGITRLEDAQAAVDLGVDALGFVFWPQSPRFIAPARATAIIRRLPPFVTAVGLFVDPADAEIAAALDAGCDLLQFHGDESPEHCAEQGARYHRPWIKALRVNAATDLRAAAQRYAGARALLLDAFVDGVPGGTGSRFDWTLIPRDLAQPLVLAGGLTPENVGDAIRMVRPFAVDVSGGVEVAKGIKDRARMAAFIEGASRVSAED